MSYMKPLLLALVFSVILILTLAYVTGNNPYIYLVAFPYLYFIISAAIFCPGSRTSSRRGKRIRQTVDSSSNLHTPKYSSELTRAQLRWIQKNGGKGVINQLSVVINLWDIARYFIGGSIWKRIRRSMGKRSARTENAVQESQTDVIEYLNKKREYFSSRIYRGGSVCAFLLELISVKAVTREALEFIGVSAEDMMSQLRVFANNQQQETEDDEVVLKNTVACIMKGYAESPESVITTGDYFAALVDSAKENGRIELPQNLSSLDMVRFRSEVNRLRGLESANALNYGDTESKQENGSTRALWYQTGGLVVWVMCSYFINFRLTYQFPSNILVCIGIISGLILGVMYEGANGFNAYTLKPRFEDGLDFVYNIGTYYPYFIVIYPFPGDSQIPHAYILWFWIPLTFGMYGIRYTLVKSHRSRYIQS